MKYKGIILHHSACTAINGKGYDYFITIDSSIIPAAEFTSPNYIHICIEGDYSYPHVPLNIQEQDQLFVINKLILRLCEIYQLAEDEVYSHHLRCPGFYFPWSELVISTYDRYH